MKPATTAVFDRQNLLHIEYEARRMRAQMLRQAGIAFGRALGRLFGRTGGAGTVQA